MEDKFRLFLESVDGYNQDFVMELHEFFLQNNCKYEIKSAKSGFVVSYILESTKRTLATYIFRKSGIRIRIYPDQVSEYEDFLDSLPEKMKKDIRKASVCKRMINLEDCNPRCVMGYRFSLDGQLCQKCRYMAFQPVLNEENNPFIKQFLEKELEHRK